MFRTRQTLTLETAEGIAAQGLAFLAEEPVRLSRFLTATGLTADQIREQVDTPRVPVGRAGASGRRRIAPARVCGKRLGCSGNRHASPGSPAAGLQRDSELMMRAPDGTKVRLGVDLGGTKIAGVALGPDGAVLAEHRIAAPRHDYAATLRAIGEMVATARAGSRRARQRRHRHAGLDLTRERPRAERQFDLAQRPAVRARSRGPPGPACPPRQRRQLLCLVGGRRRRGRRRSLRCSA